MAFLYAREIHEYSPWDNSLDYVTKEGNIVAYGTPEEVLTEAFIKTVYELDVKVIKGNGAGLIHILYKPAHV